MVSVTLLYFPYYHNSHSLNVVWIRSKARVLLNTLCSCLGYKVKFFKFTPMAVGAKHMQAASVAEPLPPNSDRKSGVWQCAPHRISAAAQRLIKNVFNISPTFVGYHVRSFPSKPMAPPRPLPWDGTAGSSEGLHIAPPMTLPV